MGITKKIFGVLGNGEEAELYTLSYGDVSLSISNYGGTIISLVLPSRSGRRDDVVLGYSTLGSYMNNYPYFGATIGRFANRIALGRFAIDGRIYTLDKNNGPNTLHGGFKGFDKYVWEAEAYEENGNGYLRLTLESPDGDEGYPGKLRAVVTYGLEEGYRLSANYFATVDAPCPINLTNHAYFNLKGEGRGDVLGHELELYASAYLPVSASLIPTGALEKTAGGPFDFSERKAMGRDMDGTGGGYDHCFAVDGTIGTLRPCAAVYEAESGRSMQLSTTQPGVQFYSGNFLDGIAGKRGSIYGKHAGFCLETQHYPDSPNQAGFPSCVYGPGRDYSERAEYSFYF
ncbi:MAG TPA: galactose-1-epimerase [Spirochaetaceae bacterium]|jgi:aldose 1-epimerase|nr:galactose-1-epimerase [Spirochaetaceae bacterium]